MDIRNILFFLFLISSVMLNFCKESAISKIAYKKSTNLKEKSKNKNNKKNISFDVQTTESTLTILSKEEDDNINTTTPYQKDLSFTSGDSDSVETSSKEDTTTEIHIKTTISAPRDDTSCTCGIFIGSQFVKGSPEPPKGDPVISTTLERTFVCNPIGQKQCQTKCLEQIVQHLPNSAKILCASLDRDIRKEKAYLFVRNCNTKWHNTNLAAGREYCCKNGLPYSCPKK